MRAPRQPRKPRKLTPPSHAERSGGGELHTQARPTLDDHVPTAPAPPPLSPDAWDEAEILSAGERASDEADIAGDYVPVHDPREDPRDTGTSFYARADELEDGEVTDADVVESGSGVLSALVARVWGAREGAGRRVKELVASRRAARADGEDVEIVVGESLNLDERREERRREQRKIRLKRVGAVAVAVAVLAAVGWVLFGSPLLRYEYDPAQITGYSDPSVVNSAEVEQVLARHGGEPMLLINERALETEITETISEVAGANVTREFPRGLSVEITEAVPVACVGPAEACTTVTADGEELTVPGEIAATLPRVGDIGSSLDRAEAVTNAIAILGALSPETRALVAEISVADGELATLTLSDGRTVYWGGLDRNEFKAQVLDVIVTQPASHYDVSTPDAPVSR